MHGELTKMYDTIAEIEDREGYKIDLVKIKNQKTKFKRLSIQRLKNLIYYEFGTCHCTSKIRNKHFQLVIALCERRFKVYFEAH